MKLRFIEFDEEIYVVVGHSYENHYDPPECFVAIPLSLCRNRSITRDLLDKDSVVIPISYAQEITDKDRIMILMLLFWS